MSQKSAQTETRRRLQTTIRVDPEIVTLDAAPGQNLPSLALLCKLGSIVVHTDELLSSKGHYVDRSTLEQLLRDEEVTAWIKSMCTCFNSP